MKRQTERKAKPVQSLEETPLAVLFHLQRDISRVFTQQVGMSLSRILVLHELLEEGEMSQNELKQRLGMEGALLTRFAKEMEKTGLITRRVDPNDNRLTLMALGQAGRDLQRKMEKLGADFEARLMDGLSTDDRAGMLRAMERIRENLSAWRE